MPTEAHRRISRVRADHVDRAESSSMVFVITRGDSVGGAQIHVRDLAARLASEGEPVLVLLGTEGPFTRDLDARGVRWRVCPGLARSIDPIRDIRAIREVHRALLRERPRLVSTHTAKAGLVGRLAAAWTGVPAVFTAHGWQFAPGIPRGQRLIVYILELVLSRLGVPTRVITVSRFDFRLARGTAAVPRRRLRLVYNGLPESNPIAVAPQVKRSISPRLAMIARFQAQKDHATLLRAIAEIPGRWELLLIGEEGPTWEDVRKLAGELGLMGGNKGGAAERGIVEKGTVEFLGHRDDVATLLASSDIYCLSSNWEGLPRSIIEAMRAELPVVATNVGGVNELVRNDITGYLVTRGDEVDLRDKLERLMTDKTRRTTLGSNGRKRYEELFTFEAMYRATRDVWEELQSATRAHGSSNLL